MSAVEDGHSDQEVTTKRSSPHIKVGVGTGEARATRVTCFTYVAKPFPCAEMHVSCLSNRARKKKHLKHANQREFELAGEDRKVMKKRLVFTWTWPCRRTCWSEVDIKKDCPSLCQPP